MRLCFECSFDVLLPTVVVPTYASVSAFPYLRLLPLQPTWLFLDLQRSIPSIEVETFLLSIPTYVDRGGSGLAGSVSRSQYAMRQVLLSLMLTVDHLTSDVVEPFAPFQVPGRQFPCRLHRSLLLVVVVVVPTAVFSFLFKLFKLTPCHHGFFKP